MLNVELARKLLPLVNDPESNGLLKAYAEARIAYHHKLMEKEADVRKSQGAIEELRRLLNLRDEAVGDAKNG